MKHKAKKPIIDFHGIAKSCFWFGIGAGFGLFLLISFTFFFFEKKYADRLYPGVMVNGINMGGKTQEEVKAYFDKKNAAIADASFTFVKDDMLATVSAKQIGLGYDSTLLAEQAYVIGRSKDVISNLSLVFQAYLNGVNLSPSYRYSEKELNTALEPFSQKFNFDPVDALFSFENGKVSAFRPSSEGAQVDIPAINRQIWLKAPLLLASGKAQPVTIAIPIKTTKPNITTDKVNNLGIKELVGTGTSLFQGSIQNRIFNVTLAATRINGILIAPGEVFSFNKALGDISAFTGFKQAYVISNGKTILGDGGGVCQVSTTLFRAVLDAGLPIEERHAHAYRVGYYEQDSGPGLDATIYSPSVDFRFKNDTGHSILIQSFVDPDFARLTFVLYGTRDGRQTTITKPVITSQTPPGETVYQDDPTLPKGTMQQTEHAAWGATVSFTREVVKNGKVILSDKYTSSYRPWAAVFLRGTKES